MTDSRNLAKTSSPIRKRPVAHAVASILVAAVLIMAGGLLLEWSTSLGEHDLRLSFGWKTVAHGSTKCMPLGIARTSSYYGIPFATEYYDYCAYRAHNATAVAVNRIMGPLLSILLAIGAYKLTQATRLRGAQRKG